MAAVLPATAGPPEAEKPFSLKWKNPLYMFSDVLITEYISGQQEIYKTE
jgi:hypothetical protein